MQTIKNQGGTIWLLLLVAAAFVAGCRPPGERALLKGKDLLEQGKPGQAVVELRTATVLLPTNAYAFNYLGLALHQSGETIEAQKAYYRALALNHEMAEARYNLGCLFLAENRLEQAKSELTAFTLRRPESAEGWTRLATAQLRSREPVAAERSFSQALRLRPQDPESLLGMGLTRLQRNRPAEAVQWFQSALKAQPDYAPALRNLAVVAQENLRDKQMALLQYRRYLELKPAPEDAAEVQRIVRQLEQDLAPPIVSATAQPTNPVQTNRIAAPVKLAVAETSAPAPAAARKPVSVIPTNDVTSASTEKVAGLNKIQQSVEPIKTPVPAGGAQPQTSSTSNSLRPSGPAAAVKAGPVHTSLPPASLEVVQVPAEQVFKPAQDVPVRPVPPSPSTTVRTSNSAAGSVASTPSKAAKRSFLSKINPVRIFSGGEDAKPAALQPSAGPALTTPAREPREITRPQPEQTAIAFSRYTYKSPAKPASGNRSEAERAYAQGVQAKQAQRLPEAIQAYRRATQLDPEYFDAWYNLGVATAEAGNLPAALAAYESALAIRPDSLDARYNFALALKQSNFPVDARNELQKLLTVYPKEGRAHLALGNLYAQQFHDPARAREHYLKVLEFDPRNPQASAIRYWLTDNPK
ncbi:MAG TPA: tetratricopeptide repeat protein [Verrucomicrobiae bacterium]